MSLRLAALDLWLRVAEKPRLATETSVPEARARLEREAARLVIPAAARITPDPLGARPALRVAGPTGGPSGRPPGTPVLLWLHGGAYCLGSPATHAAMVAALALRAGMAAILPDYRLAPEHPFPAAVDDARAAWDAALAEGIPPGRIALAGDSAGGGLAFALLHMLLAEGAAPPACLVAFSPWVDLTLAGDSLRRLSLRDAFLPASRLAEIRDLYLAGADPADPRASPWRGRFRGAPPTLIQASRAEILLDDARRIADRLRVDGARVTLDLWDAAPHVWQAYHGRVPEADMALDRAAGFLQRAFKTA